ncbi:MAG: hypothetical protein P8019_12605 [Gammaproteobacteria bacterium]
MLMLCMMCGVAQAEQVNKKQIKGLDEQVQAIKRDVLSISTQLNLLEEKLLYPSNTYMAFFVSMDKGAKFSPDSIHLTLDNKNVANYIYSYKEVQALREGGVQRVFTSNVTTGEHNLKISVIGKENGSKVTNSGTHDLKKGVGPQFVEIHLSATGVSFRDW